MAKMVEFSLTKPKNDMAFTTLRVPLKKFSKLRANFEELGLHVEVVDFSKRKS
jgi:hypothetical protein